MVDRAGFENQCALWVPRVQIPVSPPVLMAETGLKGILNQSANYIFQLLTLSSLNFSFGFFTKIPGTLANN